MLDFYQQLAKALEQGSVVLATVTHTQGSVPREVGAKMFIRNDGSIVGTIGGGAGEAKVYQQALQVLKTGEKQWVNIDLSGAPQRETQGVCGGIMQVWLELWTTKFKAETRYIASIQKSKTADIKLVNQIVDLLSAGYSATLITPFDAELQPYLAVKHQNDADRIDSSFIVENSSFIELLHPPPTLLIVGAGHIAVSLAPIAKIAGFRIIVQDDRPEFASPVRFLDASAVVALPLESVLNTLSHITELYVVLVTRNYLQDLTALRLLLPQKIQYIGMIGSKKRVNLVYQTLQKEGYYWRSLQQIYAPIGLDIGALSPEEIAVSICAELIKVRRGGTGLPLSESHTNFRF